MADVDHEMEFYRAVEDFFAAARGCPHILSPKDVQLLRSWWRDQVPLAAITTAIAEVFAKRRERGDEDATVSLSYCRHAVKRQVKHLASMRTGTGRASDTDDHASSGAALAALADRLLSAADALPDELHAAAELIRNTAGTVRELDDLGSAAVDEHLFNLESTLISACAAALPRDLRRAVASSAERAAAASGAQGDALERSRRAMEDRELRRLLGLPRLEIE